LTGLAEMIGKKSADTRLNRDLLNDDDDRR
jgi:hypothetical protein